MLIKVADGIYAKNGELTITVKIDESIISISNKALELSKNKHFVDALNGMGHGQDMSGCFSVKEAELLIRLWDEKDQREEKRKADAKAVRQEFARLRDSLLREMIDSGMEYKCAVDGCDSEMITIDHIHPISKGGTNDISNLQFMCRNHNSKKSDKENFNALV